MEGVFLRNYIFLFLGQVTFSILGNEHLSLGGAAGKFCRDKLFIKARIFIA